MAFDIANFKTTDPLSDLAIRMANDRTDFIATEVFPLKTIPKAQYKWYQHDRSNLRRVVTKKASKAEVDKIQFDVFNTTGLAVLHKLGAEVDPKDERDADAPVADLEVKAAASITERLLVDLENEAYTIVSTSGNYPTALTTSLSTGTTTWADAGGDPVGVVKDAKTAVRLACGRVPNRMAASYEVVEALRVHPALIERIKYTGTELPDNLVLQLLGLRELRTAKAIQNTAEEGIADTLASIWGDVALIYWHDATDGLEAMTYGRTFMVDNLYTYRYEDQRRGSGAGRIRELEMGWEYENKLVGRESSSSAKTVCGYLVQNAI